MVKERNPFEYGRELGRDELVDRQDELQQIDAAIRNRGKLFVIGPRRYGKTSLLNAAAENARGRGVTVLRFDAEKYETPEVLAQALLTSAARELRGSVERAIELMGQVAARLRPRIEVEPDGSVAVTIGAEPGAHGELPMLADALDAVEGLAARTGGELVVMLDEVQHLVVEHGQAAERQLRSTVQRHRHVGYVFAGSATRLLTVMTADANRPFYRLGSRLFVQEVPPNEFGAFLREAFGRTGFEVTVDGCIRILERAEHVPYNVQRLAHEVWEMLRAGIAGGLDGNTVTMALQRIVQREDPGYTQLWTSLTTNQKKTLKAVIATGGVGLQSSEVSRRLAISPSSVQVALGALGERHVVRRDQRGGSARYRLVDPFLATWIDEAQSV